MRYLVLLAIGCSGQGRSQLPPPNRPEIVTEACKAHVLNVYRPRAAELSPAGKPGAHLPHFGVDFEACPGRPVISMYRGVVVHVDHDHASGDPAYNGGSVLIMHEVPGSSNQVRMYAYMHLTNISVKQGQRLLRGETIGDPWQMDHGGWVPHVHIEIIDSLLPVPERDPLRYVRSCLSRAQAIDAQVFPIPC